MPPTSRLLSWAHRWFDPVTVAEVFEPTLADWQHEWRAASTRRGRTAAMLRGGGAFLAVALRLMPAILFASTPAPVLRAAAIRVAMFWVPMTLMLLAGFWSIRTQVPNLSLLDWANILPSQALLPTPFAIILIADLAWFNSTLRQHERRRLMFQATLGLTILMILGLGWIMPNANQAWRQALYSQHAAGTIARGLRELTAIDLLRFKPLPTRELFSRGLLIMLPLVLAIFRWWGLTLREARRGSRMRAELSWLLVVGIALTVGLYFLGRAMGLGGFSSWLGPMSSFVTVFLSGSVAVSAICEVVSQRQITRSLGGERLGKDFS